MSVSNIGQELGPPKAAGLWSWASCKALRLIAEVCWTFPAVRGRAYKSQAFRDGPWTWIPQQSVHQALGRVQEKD